MVLLKRIGVMPAAKLYAAMMAVAGFIFGLFFAIFGFLGGLVSNSPLLGFGMGLAALIVVPLIFGILGFIFGAIGAFFYNIIGGKIGGLELELE